MPNYTDEDRKAFERKDKLNARMSALKAASLNNEGKQITPGNMLMEAERYYDWLYDKVDKGSPPKSNNCEHKREGLPNPSTTEYEIMELICAEYEKDCPTDCSIDFDILKQKIYEKFGAYPTREESIEKVLSAIPINDVVI